MRYLYIIIFTMCIFGINYANARECLPDCTSNDGKFITIAGTNLSTIVDQEIVINLVSNTERLHFGIFDGEASENWDLSPGPGSRFHIKYELYADPNGDASGLAGPVIASWFGDGSAGANQGTPMANNDWSDFSFANSPNALSTQGDYVYSMRITPIDPNVPGLSENVFKIRTDYKMYVPAMFPVSFITPFGSQEEMFYLFEDLNILYPNANFNDDGTMVCGEPATEICDPNDPSCCLFETNYDGIWTFLMEVPDGLTELFVWDGDLDYGDFDETVFDTDDPNTPPGLPPWSIGTDVVPQTARPAVPHDNNGSSSEFVFVRDPSIQYFLIAPDGTSYQNFNPSGDREWELFKISTLTDNPAVAEYQVPEIPGGIWEVRLVGVDMSNLNSILLPFDLRGNPEEQPFNVPTISQWGLVAFSSLIFVVSLFYILRKRKHLASSK